MHIKLEIDDETSIYELIDTVTVAHLKNTKTMLEAETASELDTGDNEEVIKALYVLIKYYGR